MLRKDGADDLNQSA